jgi:hypothetical protein
MSEKQYLELGEQLSPDPQKLVVQLYRDYASEISKNLWPWEKARWYELVFCILTTIGEPQVLAGTTRRLTNTMSELELLDLGELAKLNPPDDSVEAVKSKLVTIDTVLQQVGFTPEKSISAVTAICEAASSIQEKYDGKVQNYLGKYGTYMLDQIKVDFGFSQFDDAPRALAIWLQNTLNMPIPASNPLADQACESLGVTYDALVEAANQQDINVALLDDALRAYWERKSNEKVSNTKKN